MSQIGLGTRLPADLLGKTVSIAVSPDDRSSVTEDPRIKQAQHKAQALRSTFTYVLRGADKHCARTPNYPGLQGVGAAQHLAADDLVGQLTLQFLWKSAEQPNR
jgi:hypothetical protein